MKQRPLIALGAALIVLGALWFRHSRATGPGSEDFTPATPKQAAAQVEQVFQQAQPEIKQAAVTAADAMRTGDFERAVVSLEVIRHREGLTLQQGMAIHNSMVNLEAQLINRIEAGDANAKRAYELLKKSKRDR